MTASLFFLNRGATFSPCRRYRYLLWRIWDPELPLAMWCMLNGSFADGERNDPTVDRCEVRTHHWGYGGLLVVNLFGWGSTDPSVLPYVEDPVGPENDRAIVEAASRAGLIVCGWGNHGGHRNRSTYVAQTLLRPYPLYCLRVTKRGEPSHPLYLPYAEKPKLWMLIRSSTPPTANP
jgi:hypothetical protein